MNWHVRKVAVLGSGVMGSAIAAHFANAGIPSLVLDIVPREPSDAEKRAGLGLNDRRVRDRIARDSVQALAKDTPNFIANRIGLHSIMVTFRVTQELGLTIEEVDSLTGAAMARPKTATYRLADLVGLDTLLYVAQNTQPLIPQDEDKQVFAAPEFLQQMVQQGLLGSKSGAGFYRRVKKPEKKILTFDLQSGEHRDPRKPDFPELKEVLAHDDPGERVRALIEGGGRAAEIAWKLLAPTLSYSAMRLGEIADTAATLDDAVKLGFRATSDRLRADGYPLPDWTAALGDGGLYREEQRQWMSATATAGGFEPIPVDPRAIRFDLLHSSGCEVRRNPSASLIDLGDGILGLEFHSKMSALGHALGCTGAKLATTALHELKRRGGRYAMVTMCIGTGMGAAGIFEAV